jgi:hypothetical protein
MSSIKPNATIFSIQRYSRTSRRQRSILTILSAGGRWIDEDGWGQSCVFAIDWWKTSCMCVAGQLDESRPILTMEKPFAALPRTEVVGLAMVSLIILAFMLSIGLS